ncbi:MAG: restriction endonuclease subunit S [Alistipes sp.]|nr:restriction endonuclease subunit S [Alistipes sp.]
MKQGWEIKKLREVCDIVGGSTPKTSEPSYWDGEHYWITPAELDGSKYISSTSRTITDEGVKSAHLQLLPSGTVLLSSRAPIGKVAITTAPMYCNQGFKNLVCSDKLYNEFAYWFLFHNTDYLNSLGTGATFKEISKRVVEQIPISIPPREEQERIVSELDCLSGVIENKREQLKQLDALAQSIFYQMFGDPITNEKRWEVKRINEVCSIFGRIGFRGYTTNDLVSNSKDGAISLSPSNIINGHLDYSKCTYISWFKYEESPEIKIYNEDILLVKTGSSYGKCALVRNLPHKATINPQFVVLKNFKINNRYLTCCLQSYPVKFEFDKFTIGAAIPTFSQKNLGNMQIAIPPLTFQQEFAEKIEAIEKQKELIKQSITQTEELFNSRMDYYFN